MKQLVNKNLITLKCVLFCFLSGIGCIFPFLPLHMLDVGLERGEARLISAVAPCVALLGPACLGLLIDKLSVGRGSTTGGTGPSGSGRVLRFVTAACLILSALFYTLLLAVPYTKQLQVHRPKVLFMCDEDGAYIIQKPCTDETQNSSCPSWDGIKTGALVLKGCEYGCADENMTWLMGTFPTSAPPPTWGSFINISYLERLTEENDDDMDTYPPHLCSDGTCSVYLKHNQRMELQLSLQVNDTLAMNDGKGNGEEWCRYVTGTEKPFSCQVVPSVLSELSPDEGECKPAVRCQVLEPYDVPNSVLADAECPSVDGDPSYSLWSYFVLRVLADIWPTAALALLGAACVVATRETSLGRGDVGRQLAFGTIGLAIFPALAGLAAKEMPESPYLVPFIMHAVFMVIGALILLFDKNMPLSTPEWWWHTATGVLAMPMNTVRRYGAETAAVFAVVALLGVLWSGIDAYLPWTVVDLATYNKTYESLIQSKSESYLEVGLTMTAGALPAIPALWWAEAVVDYIGHSNVFITAFTFYCLRYTGLAYSTDYTWIIVIELLEVFTLSLVWVTAMLYFRHLVPRRYTATGQALPVIAHFCIGRCIGAIVSGMVSLQRPLSSMRDAYRALGVVALVAAAVYLALYHLLLAPRCAAPAQPPPQNLLQASSVDGQLSAKGLNANGASNGTYSPRVYHEERSRKGHFRY